MGNLDKKLKLLPDSSGVYLMKNGQGKIIYIGKALSLRKRVRNYFNNSYKEPKTKALAGTVRDIDYIITSSQSEALILECSLIKKHHPRYNVQLRDDKKYPCIKISDDIFPRVSVVRTIRKDNSRYFGPYTNAGAVRRTLRLMRTLFMLRSCRRDMSSVSRPCLYYHLNQCMAPCTGKVSQKEYAKMVRSACLFLEGEAEKLLNELTADMKKESKALRFEKASAIRNRISALREVIEGHKTALHERAAD